jgi:hypothetical protein
MQVATIPASYNSYSLAASFGIILLANSIVETKYIDPTFQIMAFGPPHMSLCSM